jgi:hypothetical protein
VQVEGREGERLKITLHVGPTCKQWREWERIADRNNTGHCGLFTSRSTLAKVIWRATSAKVTNM